MRWLALALGVLVLWPAALRADVAACVAAAERGQVQRDERALGEARTSFLACVDAGCPPAVRKECAAWLADVEGRLPSLVILARDARGNDLPGVEVWLDERALAAEELGRELPVDPGSHRLVARLGERESTLEVSASEREKGRIVTLTLPDPPAAPVEKPVEKPAPEPERRWLGPVITLSAGAVLAGTAGILTLRAKSDADELRKDCSPYCNASKVDELETRLRVADLLLVTGAVAIAAGVTWWLWPRREPAVKVGLAPGRRAAAIGLEGKF